MVCRSVDMEVQPMNGAHIGQTPDLRCLSFQVLDEPVSGKETMAHNF